LSAAITQQIKPKEFLHSEAQKDLLRLVTAGSVDDGKSTLIGRLLYDSQSVFEDQLHAVRLASRQGLELALLTDGLRAEREQGITIDVAYRYFSTARRKFILADTPGHEQYTRNMATGASNADLAILLLDASRGIQPQSKRHACILGLLGIRHLLVLVNKMDLVAYSEQVFRSLERELSGAINQLEFETVEFFPVSAHLGTNVVHRSSTMPWFGGPSVLEYLESVDVGHREHNKPFRLPIQLAQRTQDFRGYSGQIASGRIAVGDSVTVLPSLRSTRIKCILSFHGELEQAIAPESVTLTVEDELDISRGDILVDPNKLPFKTRNVSARMVWFSELPLDQEKRYLLKHTTQTIPAEIVVESVLDIESLTSHDSGTLRINDIGTVQIETSRPIFFDPYRQNRETGSFILIDPGTNNTVAAGMIVGPGPSLKENVEKNRGIVLSLAKDHPVLARLRDGHWPTQNVAVLSNWNSKAINLLSHAGIHVIVIDAPLEKEELRSEDRLERLVEIISSSRDF